MKSTNRKFANYSTQSPYTIHNIIPILLDRIRSSKLSSPSVDMYDQATVILPMIDSAIPIYNKAASVHSNARIPYRLTSQLSHIKLEFSEYNHIRTKYSYRPNRSKIEFRYAGSYRCNNMKQNRHLKHT